MVYITRLGVGMVTTTCIFLSRNQFIRLHQQSQIRAILLGQLDQVGAQRLGSFLAEFVHVNGTIGIQVGALENSLNLLFLEPVKAEILYGAGQFVLLQNTVAIDIGGLKQGLEDGLTECRVGRVDKGGNDVAMQGNDLGAELVELVLTEGLLGQENDGG